MPRPFPGRMSVSFLSVYEVGVSFDYVLTLCQVCADNL